MYQLIGTSVGIFAELLVLAGALAAYKDKFFFVRQMKERGLKEGFPFIIHGGMWSDFFIISPLIGIITASYVNQWSIDEILIAGIVGILVSLALHFFVYLKGSIPGSHGYNAHLTIAGWTHVIYTALAVQIFALFYFATTHISHTLLLIASVLLALHLFTGLVGQIWASIYRPEWFPEKPHKNLGIWLSIALIWIFILWRCLVLWH